MCGQLDGGHHAVAGCPVLHDTIDAQRHNAAGRIILKAVAQGRHGASLYAADVGRKELMEAEGLEALPRGLPNFLKPAKCKEQKWPSRPDGVLVLRRGRGTAGDTSDIGMVAVDSLGNVIIDSKSVVLLIEVKYCADYKCREKLAECEKQHAETMAMIASWWGCEVKLHSVVLGVGGSIFRTLKATMKELGVTGNAYRSMAHKLNMSAAEYVEKAMQFRWARVQCAQPGSQQISITCRSQGPSSGGCQFARQHKYRGMVGGNYTRGGLRQNVRNYSEQNNVG
jgi:hypothetical protein